jgi:uncharacterized protein YjiS (DUF1127 family)
MNTLTQTRSIATATATIRTKFAVLLAWLGRLINNWVAAAIAHRERQAAITTLHHLSDRELKDIGIYRGEIDVELAKALRRRMQRLHRSRRT